ncbi:MAG: hypothetical protein HY899_02145 [Deltaproteobacteria bacterium]|nr:hypothetical protein [Deltaproteobacteria bacterium]
MTETTLEDVAGEDGGWRPKNLSDGPVQAAARAVRQIHTGGVAGALWGLVLWGCVGLRLLDVPCFSSVDWDMAAGTALLLFSLGAAARSQGAMAILALLVAADLPVQVLALRDATGHGTSVATTVTIVRLGALPLVLYLVTRGYRGAVDYRRLRGGAPPKNWRMWAPLPFIGGFLAYLGAVLFVALFWRGALQYTFGQSGARFRGQDKVLTPLMKSLYADLHSIDVKPFREGSGTDETGKQAPGDGKGASGAASGGIASLGDLESLPKPVRDAVEEATRFAAQVDNVGCFGEAMRRHDTCTGDECRLLAKIFMTACLPASRPTKDFCAGVPSPISIVETTAWRTRVCDQGGREPEPCYVFFVSLQNFCHPEAVEG